MKTTVQTIQWSVWRLLAVCVIWTAIVAGCGMGDLSAGVGSGGTGTFTASLSGSVTDGYLINAVVFLDKNSNYQLDSGEPFAATDANGISTLTVEAAEMVAYPVVALAIKGVTIDSKTKQVIESNYVLSFPKGSINNGSSNLISPISSQLRELMETGKYSTTQQAMDALAIQLGLPTGTNILVDYIASNNTAMQATATTIADLMSLQMDRIMNSTMALDVERYRAMMALIESNMTIVAQLNTPENLANLSNNIANVLDTMPVQLPQNVSATIVQP